ncbi:MAG: dihydrodipicolinate synthase family protein [Acidobacteriaceae bacterium]|nr:dihydrodipicolinate synthase family protein [Acidobacteriaceae bacterium]
MNWFGVMPAMTTPFDANLDVDHAFLAKHCEWLLANGCKGLVMLGSLGEGATLEHDEKVAILKTAVKASEKTGTPVVASISALSTKGAVQLAKDAEAAGCSGLMVLPPYVYTADWRDMKAHVVAIMEATKLPCMLYNNPIAYKTDFQPWQIAELAGEFENLKAVKESSADVRRVSHIRELLGDRLKIFVGVDDVLVEAVDAGATGWVAGLVNAFPKESVELFELALAGKRKEAYELYHWFLPLLRLDTVPKFVQLIKWVQGETGTGSATVRAPRLEITGAELEETKAVLSKALKNRPTVTSTPFPGV